VLVDVCKIGVIMADFVSQMSEFIDKFGHIYT
jgi:hypothetical protein